MKQIFTKKLIALLCAFVLLPWGALLGINALRAEAETDVTLPEELERWSIVDVGMANGDYTYVNNTTAQSGVATGATLDKKAFTTNVIFPEVTEANRTAELWIGEFYNGLVFVVQNGELVLKHCYKSGGRDVWKTISTLDPAKFNLETLLGDELALTVTTEFVDNDGTTTDVNIGVYINEILYNESYLTLGSVPVTAMPQQICTYTRWSGGKALWLGAPITPIEDFDVWTITDVNMATGDYAYGANNTPVGGMATGATVDRKAFTTNVIFPEITEANRNAELWVGEQYNGLGFVVQNGNLVFQHMYNGDYQTTTNIATLKPAQVNATSFLGRKLTLTITAEFVKNNGTTTDVNLVVYIDGVQYNEDYYTVTSVPITSLQQQVQVFTRWSGGKSIWLAEPITSVDELEEWTIADVNMATGEYTFGANNTAVGGTLTGKNLDKKAFTTNVIFPEVTESGRNAELWIGEQYNGLGFVVQNGNLVLQHMYNKDYTTTTSLGTIDPAKLNNTVLLGEKISLTVTTEFLKKSETITDVNIGVYVNGNLYNGGYFRLKSVPVTSLQQQVQVFTRWSGGKPIWLGTPVTPLEDFERWTIDTVGMAEGEYSVQDGTATDEAQNMKAFATAVEFPVVTEEKRNAELWIGEQYNGLGFIVQNGNLVLQHMYDGDYKTTTTLATLDPAKVNLSTLLGQEIDMIVTVEFADGNATTTDVSIGLYINGILYGDGCFYLNDVPVSSFAQQVSVFNKWSGGKTTWLSSELKAEAVPVTSPELLKSWNISDVGLTDGEYGGFKAGTATGKTQDQKAFSATVEFSASIDAVHNSNLWIGEEFNGYLIQAGREGKELTFAHYVNKKQTYICILEPEEVGLTTLRGEKLDLIITTEFANTNKKTTDVNVGVYINGVLYNGRYIKIKNVSVSAFKQQVVVDNRTSGGKTTWLWADSQAELEELTAGDFGLQDKVVVNESITATCGEDSLEATAINMMLHFPGKKGNALYFGGATCGIRLLSKGNGTLALAYINSEGVATDIATMNAKTAKVSALTDKELQMRFVFKIYKVQNTMDLGIFVDGKLYNEQYFTVNNVDITNLMRVLGIHAIDGTFKVSTPQYEELTFNDFSILDVYKDMETIAPSYQRYNYCDWALFDATAVTGIVNFPNGRGANLVFGGDKWQGLQINSMPNGCIEVAYSDTKGMAKFFNLEPSKVGEASLTGKDIKLRLTFELLEVSDGKTDLKLGVYINDRLYDDKFFMIADVDKTVLTRTGFVCATAGPVKIQSVEESIDMSIYGVDDSWKKYFGL